MVPYEAGADDAAGPSVVVRGQASPPAAPLAGPPRGHFGRFALHSLAPPAVCQAANNLTGKKIMSCIWGEWRGIRMSRILFSAGGKGVPEDVQCFLGVC